MPIVPKPQHWYCLEHLSPRKQRAESRATASANVIWTKSAKSSPAALRLSGSDQQLPLFHNAGFKVWLVISCEEGLSSSWNTFITDVFVVLWTLRLYWFRESQVCKGRAKQVAEAVMEPGFPWMCFPPHPPLNSSRSCPVSCSRESVRVRLELCMHGLARQRPSNTELLDIAFSCGYPQISVSRFSQWLTNGTWADKKRLQLFHSDWI